MNCWNWMLRWQRCDLPADPDRRRKVLPEY